MNRIFGLRYFYKSLSQHWVGLALSSEPDAVVDVGACERARGKERLEDGLVEEQPEGAGLRGDEVSGGMGCTLTSAAAPVLRRPWAPRAANLRGGFSGVAVSLQVVCNLTSRCDRQIHCLRKLVYWNGPFFINDYSLKWRLESPWMTSFHWLDLSLIFNQLMFCYHLISSLLLCHYCYSPPVIGLVFILLIAAMFASYCSLLAWYLVELRLNK